MAGHSHTHRHSHTHDDHDWAARLEHLRRTDEVETEARRDVAGRLLSGLEPGATVVDVGSGAGGMAAQLGLALASRGGGTVVLVDAVPELLDAATEYVGSVLDEYSGEVEVRTVLADATDDALPGQVPPADLVWASRVVHHLRDQQDGINRLARLLTPGGTLALAEGGLGTKCVPWDLGIGRPGLVDRMIAARAAWFVDMRLSIPDAVRMEVGWTRALANAGLSDVTSFSYLVDHPAPVSDRIRAAVIEWFSFMAEMSSDRLDEDDRAAIERLLDPSGTVYIGARDDLFYLFCDTVHLGQRPK
jgi:SAM-dependent methyltransferase